LAVLALGKSFGNTNVLVKPPARVTVSVRPASRFSPAAPCVSRSLHELDRAVGVGIQFGHLPGVKLAQASPAEQEAIGAKVRRGVT
jgi:hypothetical protein